MESLMRAEVEAWYVGTLATQIFLCSALESVKRSLDLASLQSCQHIRRSSNHSSIGRTWNITIRREPQTATRNAETQTLNSSNQGSLQSISQTITKLQCGGMFEVKIRPLHYSKTKPKKKIQVEEIQPRLFSEVKNATFNLMRKWKVLVRIHYA